MAKELKLVDERSRAELIHQLLCQAERYFIFQTFFKAQPRGRKLRDSITRVCDGLNDALTAIDELPFNATLVASAACETQPATDGAGETFRAQRQKLLSILKVFEDARDGIEPRNVRQLPHFVLEEVVGAMMLLLENATGNRAKARRRHRGKDEATLVNAEARVIDALIRRVDRTVNLTSTVSKMELIERRSKGRSLTEFRRGIVPAGLTVVPQ